MMTIKDGKSTRINTWVVRVSESSIKPSPFFNPGFQAFSAFLSCTSSLTETFTMILRGGSRRTFRSFGKARRITQRGWVQQIMHQQKPSKYQGPWLNSYTLYCLTTLTGAPRPPVICLLKSAKAGVKSGPLEISLGSTALIGSLFWFIWNRADTIFKTQPAGGVVRNNLWHWAASWMKHQTSHWSVEKIQYT